METNNVFAPANRRLVAEYEVCCVNFGCDHPSERLLSRTEREQKIDELAIAYMDDTTYRDHIPEDFLAEFDAAEIRRLVDKEIASLNQEEELYVS